MHYFVVGVNGSGKTSVLDAVSQQTDIPVVHGTGALMERLGIAGDYAALRALDQAYVLEQWGKTAIELTTQYSDKAYLLDTHILNLTNGLILRRDGAWIAHYDALVLVTCEASIVLARINKDHKDRALFPVGFSETQKLTMLEDYQIQTEELFRELAAQYARPAITIINNGPLDAAVRQFITFDQSLLGH